MSSANGNTNGDSSSDAQSDSIEGESRAKSVIIPQQQMKSPLDVVNIYRSKFSNGAFRAHNPTTSDSEEEDDEANDSDGSNNSRNDRKNSHQAASRTSVIKQHQKEVAAAKAVAAQTRMKYELLVLRINEFFTHHVWSHKHCDTQILQDEHLLEHLDLIHRTYIQQNEDYQKYFNKGNSSNSNINSAGGITTNTSNSSNNLNERVLEAEFSVEKTLESFYENLASAQIPQGLSRVNQNEIALRQKQLQEQTAQNGIPNSENYHNANGDSNLAEEVSYLTIQSENLRQEFAVFQAQHVDCWLHQAKIQELMELLATSNVSIPVDFVSRVTERQALSARLERVIKRNLALQQDNLRLTNDLQVLDSETTKLSKRIEVERSNNELMNSSFMRFKDPEVQSNSIISQLTAQIETLSEQLVEQRCENERLLEEIAVELAKQEERQLSKKQSQNNGSTDAFDDFENDFDREEDARQAKQDSWKIKAIRAKSAIMEERQSIETEKQQIEDELERLTEENDRIKRQLENLVSENSSFMLGYKAVQKQFKDALKENDSLKSKIADLKEEYGAATAAASGNGSVADSSVADRIAEIEKERDTAIAEQKRIEKQLKELQEKHSDEQVQLNAENTELKKQLNEAEQRISMSQLEAEFDSEQKSQQEEEENQTGSQSGSQAEWQQKIEELKEQKSRVELEVTNTKDTYKSIEKQFRKTIKETDELRRKLSEAEARVKSLEESLQSAVQDTPVSAAVQPTVVVVAAADAAATTADNQINVQAVQAVGSDSRVEELEATCNQLTTDNDNLKSVFKTLNNELKRQVKESDDARKRIKVLEAQLLEPTTSSAAATATNQDTANDQLRMNYEALIKSHEDLKAQVANSNNNESGPSADQISAQVEKLEAQVKRLSKFKRRWIEVAATSSSSDNRPYEDTAEYDEYSLTLNPVAAVTVKSNNHNYATSNSTHETQIAQLQSQIDLLTQQHRLEISKLAQEIAKLTTENTDLQASVNAVNAKKRALASRLKAKAASDLNALRYNNQLLAQSNHLLQMDSVAVMNDLEALIESSNNTDATAESSQQQLLVPPSTVSGLISGLPSQSSFTDIKQKQSSQQQIKSTKLNLPSNNNNNNNNTSDDDINQQQSSGRLIQMQQKLQQDFHSEVSQLKQMLQAQEKELAALKSKQDGTANRVSPKDSTTIKVTAPAKPIRSNQIQSTIDQQLLYKQQLHQQQHNDLDKLRSTLYANSISAASNVQKNKSPSSSQSSNAQLLDQMYQQSIERSKNILSKNEGLLSKPNVQSSQSAKKISPVKPNKIIGSPSQQQMIISPSQSRAETNEILYLNNNIAKQNLLLSVTSESEEGGKVLSQGSNSSRKINYSNNNSSSNSGNSASRKVKPKKEGERYIGERLMNMRHGTGCQFEVTGESYEGEWMQDMRHGYGIQKDEFGIEIYNGEWENSAFNGSGRLRNQFMGASRNAQQSGQMHHQNDLADFETKENPWQFYTGDFSADLMHGNGTLLLCNGDTFTGQFIAGRVHGQGQYHSAASSETVTGIWQNGKLVMMTNKGTTSNSSGGSGRQQQQ